MQVLMFDAALHLDRLRRVFRGKRDERGPRADQQGKGEDDDGEVIINALMVTNGDNDKVYFVFVAASPEGAKEHSEDLAKVIGSIRKVD